MELKYFQLAQFCSKLIEQLINHRNMSPEKLCVRELEI